MCFARILYDNILKGATITAVSTEAPGFPASSLLNSMTYERWRPMYTAAYVAFDAGAPVTAQYVGIASHTLGSVGAPVEIESSTDGTTWVNRFQRTPTSDSPILAALKTTVTARYWRVRIRGSNVASIGVLYLGRALDLLRSAYGGHSPGTLSRNTTIMPNKSEGGQFLGRSVIRQGFATSFSWKNLPAAWYRANFDPFVKSAIVDPFFIAWNPQTYPNEVLYAWCNSDIQPTNQGVRDYMSVGFSVEAIG